MDTADIQSVRLEQAGAANFFVRHRPTDKLIGRVWQESNGEWWATFYLGQGAAARNVSGGRFGAQDDAVAAVRARQKDQ
ncbi:hypothetical protein ACFW5V_28485 [Streptomyces sp. NPDC058762]|uniref:hypothetical protein n=1 Tax=Streptomyces sp. NPDC058762 TaxID=3346629 RepID=UPI0036ADDBFA